MLFKLPTILPCVYHSYSTKFLRTVNFVIFMDFTDASKIIYQNFIIAHSYVTIA